MNQMILQNELFNYWVIKESYMKYTGMEFHLKLESFTTIIENNDKNNIKYNSFDVENYKIAFACNQSTNKIFGYDVEELY
ncbi:MAG: 4'-phosphopantetheinyl transferase superfamily protein [Methanosphaera stadtmanae]|nr:4'-phosphopantetheinyl transferase superfamily protein [Methanosphaera stadtmanae]